MSAAGGAWSVALRYDRFEDRLVLSFTGAEGLQRFWITRRQCAGLIKSLSPAARKTAAQAPLPRGKGPGAGVQNHTKTPVLAEIILRKTAATVRLGFRSDGADVGALQFVPAEFARLQAVMCRMAEAAQWSFVMGSPGASTGNAPMAAVARRLH